MAQWQSGTVGDWHSGRVAQWRSGLVAQWHRGTMGKWHSGTVEQWQRGNLCPSHICYPRFETLQFGCLESHQVTLKRDPV